MNRCTVVMSTLCRLAVVQTDYSCFKRCKHYRGTQVSRDISLVTNAVTNPYRLTQYAENIFLKREKKTCYPGAYQRSKELEVRLCANK